MKYVSGNWNDMPWQPFPGREETCSQKVFTGEKGTMNMAKFKKGHPVRPHDHEWEQISMILEGVCDFYVGGEKYHLEAGGYVVIPPFVEHYLDVVSDEVINMDVYLPRRDERMAQYQGFLDAMNAEK